MKKCPECGNELPDDVLECNQCGYPFEEEQDNFNVTQNNKKEDTQQFFDLSSDNLSNEFEHKVRIPNLPTKEKVKSVFQSFSRSKDNVSKKFLLAILIVAVIAIGFIGKGIVNEKIIIPNKQYKTAEQMLTNGKYEEAAKQFKKLGNFKDSSKRVDECYYEKGIESITKENYELAISSFEKSVTFKDSKDKITESYYLWGVKTKEEGNLIEASDYFEKSLDYKDALKQYNECIYKYAKKVAKETYNYDKASEYLKKIDYKDSKELVKIYSDFSKKRVFNGRFYWFPHEYFTVLNKLFDDLGLNTYVDDIKISGDFCQFTCYSGYSECASIILDDVDDENGYFKKIKLQGYISNSDIAYPMIAIIGLLVEDLQIDTAKEVGQELLDMNPSGSLVKDGVHYTYTNTDGFLTLEVEPSTGESSFDIV